METEKEKMSYTLLNESLENGHNLEGLYAGKTVIITGSADCLWTDYLAAKQVTEDEDLMCINLSVICFWHRHVEHLITLHHEAMPHFYAAAQVERAYKESRPRRNKKIITHSNRGEKGEKIDVCWDVSNPGGTSGLFAATVALRLGYEKIILCGIPMDNRRRFYDSPNKEFKYSGISQQDPWQYAAVYTFGGKVKSMSGNTLQLLGKPTKEWLKS